MVWSYIKKILVDSSISRCRNLQQWVHNHFKKSTNLPLIIVWFKHFKCCFLFNYFTISCCRPCHFIKRTFIGTKISPANKLRGQICDIISPKATWLVFAFTSQKIVMICWLMAWFHVVNTKLNLRSLKGVFGN